MQLDKEISISKDVAESRKLLKQEYEKQKYGEIFREIEREEQYKPIVKPLQDLVAKTMSYQEPMKAIKEPLEPPPKAPEELLKAIEEPLWNKDEMKEMGDTAVKYLGDFFNKKIKVDETFGIRGEMIAKEGHLLIGNRHLNISNNDISVDGGKTFFKGPKGLWELITYAEPQNYTKEDLHNYEEILKETNVHRRDYDSSKPRKGSARFEYQTIIKPLTEMIKHEPQSMAEELKNAATGKGLRKIVTDYPVEYVYYHNPKDLKYRYKVLLGEIYAGNNDPLKYNELVNIQKLNGGD